MASKIAAAQIATAAGITVVIANGHVPEVLPRLARGELRPLIDRDWPIQQAGEAMEYLASDASIGKVLLAVSGEG